MATRETRAIGTELGGGDLKVVHVIAGDGLALVALDAARPGDLAKLGEDVVHQAHGVVRLCTR